MISVIIPTWNPEDYFYELIDSLEMQSLNSSLYEVIIVFNNTDKEKVQLFSEYINKCLSNFKIVDIPESGVSLARNIGLNYASKDYICFLDDDDIISSNYLEELLKVSNEKTLGIANVKTFVDDSCVQKDYFLTFDKKFKDKFSLKYKSNLSSIWGKLIHKNIISDFRFNVNLKLGEDSLFMFLLSKNLLNVESTDINCLYLRRIRRNSAVNIKRNKYFYLLNFIILCREYTIIFFSDPYAYSLLLYINRLMACFKSLILFIFKKHG